MGVDICGKMFGVALDVSDDPWNLQLRLASAWAQDRGQELDPGPYEAMVREIGGRLAKIELAGSVPIPSWLWPRPRPSDRPFITQAKMQEFVDGGGVLEVSRQVKDFVARRILPQRPIMIGVDHSATGGVISALSEALGAGQLTVVVLDYHFDGLPAAARMSSGLEAELNSSLPQGLYQPNSTDHDYCCGSFWAHLINSGLLKPEHLLFVGVGDYPVGQVGAEWESFRKTYLGFEERGCGFFPRADFEGTYRGRLAKFLRDRITTPHIYVSLDLDVGSGRCVHAARYMDGLGIDRKQLVDVAQTIAQNSMSGAFDVVGMDVMEFNLHLLGSETPSGIADTTLETAWAFLDALVGRTG